MKANLVVTASPFDGGDVKAHVDTSSGEIVVEEGHLDTPDLTITVEYDTAKALFVDLDVTAAMQAFMAGKVKVQGDITKLMAMGAPARDRRARPSPSPPPLVYSMTLALWGFGEAILAALCTLLLPRALFHAGLACFDAPIMTLWFATVYAYWRCLDGRKWPWQVGVVFGLALATKHNAVLLPFALGLHYVDRRVGASGALVSTVARDRLARRARPADAVRAVAVAVDRADHARARVARVPHEPRALQLRVPRPQLERAAVPVARRARHDAVHGAGRDARRGDHRHRRCGSRAGARKESRCERAPALLLGLSAAASMGPFFLGSTPIFGAEKHWMPALPTLCIAAGVGAQWAARIAASTSRACASVDARLAHRIALGVVGGIDRARGGDRDRRRRSRTR